MGGQSASEQHISTLTDSIILLRYIQQRKAMDRGLMVLKMRGSEHDKNPPSHDRWQRDACRRPFDDVPDVFGESAMAGPSP